MKVLILAAGYAVRLQNLTSDTPKSLLNIGKKKIIDRILEKVKGIENIDNIYIITNDKFFGKFDSWLKNSKYHSGISLINDGSTRNENRLGAVKDLELAIKKEGIEEDLLVIAGDNLFEFKLGKFIEFALSRIDGTSVALHDIKDHKSASRFGVVKVDEDNRVVDFEEKPENPKSTLISTGIYYFPKDKLSLIEKYFRSSDRTDAPGYCISWLSKMDKVYGFVFDEDWYDIGDLDSYRKANSEYLKKENKRNDKR